MWPFFALTAIARPEYRETIPNGLVKGCSTCHLNPVGGGTRNAFGVDHAALPVWQDLAPLDSDGDGATNGVELGDPEGTWRPGDTPGAFLSLPGDPASVPPVIDTGDRGGTGDTGAPTTPTTPAVTDGPAPEGRGGCDQSGSSGGGWAALVLVLGSRRRPTHHP
ncbi:MAG: hypothetical protein ABMB14_21510 [Myxococcota bacterium]